MNNQQHIEEKGTNNKNKTSESLEQITQDIFFMILDPNRPMR